MTPAGRWRPRRSAAATAPTVEVLVTGAPRRCARVRQQARERGRRARRRLGRRRHHQRSGQRAGRLRRPRSASSRADRATAWRGTSAFRSNHRPALEVAATGRTRSHRRGRIDRRVVVLQRRRRRPRRADRPAHRRARRARAASPATPRSPSANCRGTALRHYHDRAATAPPSTIGRCSSRSPTRASTATARRSRPAAGSMTACSIWSWWRRSRCGASLPRIPALFSGSLAAPGRGLHMTPVSRCESCAAAVPDAYHADGEPALGRRRSAGLRSSRRRYMFVAA